jgi:hypothetical protein
MGAKDVVCFKLLRGSALTLRGAGRLTTESFRLWFGCLAASANEEARMENAIGVDPSDAAEERHQTWHGLLVAGGGKSLTPSSPSSNAFFCSRMFFSHDLLNPWLIQWGQH